MDYTGLGTMTVEDFGVNYNVNNMPSEINAQDKNNYKNNFHL